MCLNVLKVGESSRRLENVSEGSRRFEKVREGSRKLKKVREGFEEVRETKYFSMRTRLFHSQSPQSLPNGSC